jgi:hypothetical protein
MDQFLEASNGEEFAALEAEAGAKIDAKVSR